MLSLERSDPGSAFIADGAHGFNCLCSNPRHLVCKFAEGEMAATMAANLLGVLSLMQETPRVVNSTKTLEESYFYTGQTPRGKTGASQCASLLAEMVMSQYTRNLLPGSHFSPTNFCPFTITLACSILLLPLHEGAVRGHLALCLQYNRRLQSELSQL